MVLQRKNYRPDASMFESCYNKYKNYMYSIAYEKLQDIHIAEDAVQTSFEKLAKVFSKVDNINSEYTKNLIKIITINTCKDMLRKKAKAWKPFHLKQQEKNYILMMIIVVYQI